MLKQVFASAFVALLVAGCATGKSGFPPESDGLKLVPDTQLAAVYMKPGAKLDEYSKIALLEPYVAFAKDWQRDYNQTATFEDQVSNADMQKIRKEVGTAFSQEMTRVLTADGRQMVTAGGEGVLILRPAIIDLRITAPDLMTPGMEATFVASAGSMTLYMELLDGKTGALIGKVIDPEAADDAGLTQISNSVTNLADFDRVVRRWAQILNAHLAKLTRQ